MSTPEVFFRETIDLGRYSNSVSRKFVSTYNDIIVASAKKLRQIDLSCSTAFKIISLYVTAYFFATALLYLFKSIVSLKNTSGVDIYHSSSVSAGSSAGAGGSSLSVRPPF